MHLFYRYIYLLYLLSISQGLVGQQIQDTLLWETGLSRVEALLDSAHYEAAEELLAPLQAEIISTGSPAWQARVLHSAGWLALDQARYEVAFRHFRQALQLTHGARGEQQAATAQAHNDLGQYYFLTGRPDSAWQQHQAALRIRLQVLGPQHDDTSDSYNNLGNILQNSGAHLEALEYYQQALRIRQRNHGRRHLQVAAALNNLGSALLSLDRLDAARSAFRESLNIRLAVLDDQHPLIGRSRLNLGNVFYEDRQLDSAVVYYESALQNARLHYPPEHPLLADLYENLGNCALQRSQLETAERLHRQALDIRSNNPSIDPVARAQSLLHLGDVYREKGDYPQALAYSQRGSAALEELLAPRHPLLANAWEKTGLTYLYLGHLEEARKLYQQVLNLRFETLGQYHPLVAGVYTNLGNIYWLQADYEESTKRYQIAMAIWNRLNNGHQAQQADLFSNIGNNHFEQEQWQEAIQAYRSALQLIITPAQPVKAALWRQIGLALDRQGRQQEALAAFVTARQLLQTAAGIEAAREVLYLDEAIGATLLHCYQKRGHTDTLQLALTLFDSSLSRLIRWQESFTQVAVRQQMTTYHYRLFSGIIEGQLLAWEQSSDSTHLWRAFALSEQSKNLRLREKWMNRPATISALAKRSPLALALDSNEATANALRQLLAAPRAILSFFSGRETLYWFYLDADRLQAGRLSDLADIQKRIGQLEAGITAYPQVGSRQKVYWDSVYTREARALYQLIWEPLTKAVALPEEIILVTDGSLSFLPFNVLLTEMPLRAMRYRSYPYLLRQHQFSYAYSVALLAQTLVRSEPTTGQGCLAIAPVFEGHQPPLAPLDYNAGEVRSLQKMIGATTLIGPEASLDTFLQLAPHYRILHLATHGISGIQLREYAYLAFSLVDESTPGRLYVRDLYELDLPADLVVMSACRSGVGTHLRGEGTISLDRGFTMAGARSVVSTLWPVNDAKTADFMVKFYDRLRKQNRKDAALRAVQLRYLRTASQEEAHPFFWAAYVPLGDMSALDLEGRFSLIAVTIGLMLLLVMGWVFRRFIRRRRNIS